MYPNTTQHNKDFSTSGQIQPEDVTHIANSGYKSIINNRPDFEGGLDQPTGESIARAAQAIGLAYYHLPVVSGQYTPEQVQQMADILEKAPKPIFCFCRSGRRSTQLYQLAQQV
jgi:uncharacterized protein (TIGR01244 family)